MRSTQGFASWSLVGHSVQHPVRVGHFGLGAGLTFVLESWASSVRPVAGWFVIARNQLATEIAETRSERVLRRVAESAALAGNEVVTSQLLLVKRLEMQPTCGILPEPDR
jgi:hypothetical protein